MDVTRRLWLASYDEVKGRGCQCATCEGDFSLLDTDSELIRLHGVNLEVCKPCDIVLRRIERLGRSVLELVPALMRTRMVTRLCELCGDSFDLHLDHHVYHGASRGRTESGFAYGQVDLFYANIFASVCPACTGGAERDYRRGSGKTHLARLYELFLLTGRVPTQDLGSLIYACRDKNAVLQCLRLLQKTRTPKGYADEFGSFLGALVASGILPEGSRKMSFGTMVLARDGHLCLSISEKEIDDFLSDHGLDHDKEVAYPDSTLRCDWEVFAEADCRVFIEYFGLMGNRDYARRAKVKIDLARNAGIELVALYPDADWVGTLAGRFRLPSGST